MEKKTPPRKNINKKKKKSKPFSFTSVITPKTWAPGPCYFLICYSPLFYQVALYTIMQINPLLKRVPSLSVKSEIIRTKINRRGRIIIRLAFSSISLKNEAKVINHQSLVFSMYIFFSFPILVTLKTKKEDSMNINFPKGIHKNSSMSHTKYWAFTIKCQENSKNKQIFYFIYYFLSWKCR